MAWQCSGVSNEHLVNNLLRKNIIHSPSVVRAMKNVNRANYSPTAPFEDSPQLIGHKATISAPHMHGFVLEFLLPCLERENARVLDVGCGSGYLLSVISRLNPTSKVIGIDYIPELTKLSRENIMKEDGDLLSEGRIMIVTGDGWKGFEGEGPYDAIHVGAAAESIPDALVSQLKRNGKMIIPVGPQHDGQELLVVEKDENNKVTYQSLMGVQYVPLVKN